MTSVLVVDDEFGIVESLGEVLGEEGFAVTIARNGKDALRKLAEAPCDVVLLDYMMPVMDGRETLRTMRADPQLASVPVIMMSAMPRANIPQDCEIAGFLRKPFDIDDLLRELSRVLAEHTKS